MGGARLVRKAASVTLDISRLFDIFKSRANEILGGYGGQQTGGKRRRDDGNNSAARPKQQRRSYLNSAAELDVVESVRDSQQEKAAASARVAVLDRVIENKRKFLASFGITNPSKDSFKELDLEAIDAEHVRRRDEKALEKSKEKLASRVKGRSAAQSNVAPEHSNAMVSTSSEPSSNVPAPKVGPEPLAVEQRPSPAEHTSSGGVLLTDRTLVNDTSMDADEDAEEEVIDFSS